MTHGNVRAYGNGVGVHDGTWGAWCPVHSVWQLAEVYGFPMLLVARPVTSSAKSILIQRHSGITV